MLNVECRMNTHSSFSIHNSAFVFSFPKYSDDFNDKTCQNQNGRQGNTLKIKHFFIEYIGVVGATAQHEDKPQGKQGNTDEQDDEILFAEKHDFLIVKAFSNLFLYFFCFFCHSAKFLQR